MVRADQERHQVRQGSVREQFLVGHPDAPDPGQAAEVQAGGKMGVR